jgi:aminoglycoside/choline kinase family phosphotransferase
MCRRQKISGKIKVDREQQIDHWLLGIPGVVAGRELVAGDASFRRYFRVATEEGVRILMDAPPPGENCLPYIQVGDALRARNIRVPQIFHQDRTQGLLLIEDFGDLSLEKLLTRDNMVSVYKACLGVLLRLQQTSATTAEGPLPPYDEKRLNDEMVLFRTWFLEGLLGWQLDARQDASMRHTFGHLVATAMAQPRVFVHRDYHCRNIMWTDDAPALLDFQDALEGPVTYDLVSLLRDCYVNWSDDAVYSLALGHRDQLRATGVIGAVSDADWVRWFDWMGMQRHLKAVGIFARLKIRDGRNEYLTHIPRTLGYIRKVAEKYPESAGFADFTAQIIRPLLKSIPGLKP